MKFKIKDICRQISSGGTPFRRNEKYYKNGKIKWLKTQELNDRNIYDTEEKITEIGLQKSSAKLMPPNTVSIAMYGATVGKLGILKEEMATNQACCNMVVDPVKADYRFLFYSLLYNRHKLVGLANGAAQQNLNKKIISEFPVDYYPLDEQKRIVSILSSFDDKIELYHQINQDLEEMAQAIFKSWFVDFEPFQDGEFVDSELGPIPKGWEVKNFGSLIETLIGGDWGKSEPEKNHNQQVYCIRGADIPEINLGRDGKVPIRYILKKNLQKKISVEGDLIVEISGGSPTQSTGRVAIVTKDLIERFSNKLICTNFCRLIRPKNDEFSYFIYYYWKYLYAKDVFFIYENGTTGIKNLDIYGFLKTFKIIVPPVEKIQEFNALIKDKLSFIQKNGEQNQILSNLRDTLLPKLMSGEIRV